MGLTEESLRRIEEKLDTISEKVTTIVVKEQALEKTVERQGEDLAKLKVAYYKALGVLTFVTFPGVMTTLWLGFQLYMQKH
jgi:septal ring factor EnvC (AmiA/AmiB activator)